ncbi:BED FINGER-RELATED [Salix purpurea]|uniref:BED FINGER-RELATED n=1 Tax=Salix purpurea TaxID=77065 RepID=A0A9Q0VX15_SALPP|nr:BED FINGER-RELATED [Salix purpurea]
MADLLFNKLVESAKAIEGGNLDVAESLLKEIRCLVSTEPNIATRKVVKTFAEALVRRVNGLHPRYPLPLVPSSNLEDFYNYVFYPFYWFSYFTTAHAIHAFRSSGNKPLHVIDFSVMLYTSLWYDLMRDLASQPGGLPSFRLTSIVPKLSRSFDYLQQIRCKLTRAAERLRVDFELRQVVANNAKEIIECCESTVRRTREDEMIVVRWSFSLHKLLSQEGALEQVLSKMNDLKPDIMIIVEQEADHNGSDFMDRFVKSFQYYSTIFHSLEEDKFYRDVDGMELWKRNFRRQIGNVVACEGIDRVERHESLHQWQERLLQAGFHPMQQWWNNDRLIFQLKYRIQEKDGHPMLYRHDCPLLVTSVWKHSDPSQFSNGPITLQDVTMFSPDEKSDLMTSSESESEDEQADYREDNMLSPRIAASANLHDILEYVCHVHKFPLALTWISHREEGNANSNEKRILQIEDMACYVNSCWKNRFVDGYLECYIKEGQGIAGKALQSNLHFVPRISQLDVVDYPFLDYANKYSLHAAVAIKLTSACTSTSINDYVVEFFLPPHLKESSEQHLSINGLLRTLQKKCGHLWKLWCMETNKLDGSRGMLGEVGECSIPPAAFSGSSQLVLSDGVPSMNEIMELDIYNQTSDGMETHEPLEQEIREQYAMAAPAINAGIELPSNGNASAIRNMPISKQRKVSRVWEGFMKHEGKHGEAWAICKYCNKRYRAESTRGTSNLHKHLQKCLSKRQGGAEQQSSPLVESGDLITSSVQRNLVLDQEGSHLNIARMMIKHGYPLDMVQHEFFRTFVENLQPMFKLHSKDMVEADVLVVYRQEKEKLIKCFDNLSCLFSLTIELLSSDDRNMTYCCLTLHFIDDEWEQKKKILAFRNLQGDYDADTIQEIIKSVIIEWSIGKNLHFIWLNIAPPNDQMNGELQSKLSDQDSLINGDACFLSSYNQIAHLLIQDGLFKIKSDKQKASLDVPGRWDTTFSMLENALDFRNAFAYLEQTDGDFRVNPSVEEWNTATIILDCLKKLILQESVRNASTGVELYFLNVCCVYKNLIQWRRSQHTFVRSIVDTMLVRFDEFWNKFGLALGILTILNPCFKLDVVEYGYGQIYGRDANLFLPELHNDLKRVYHRYANDSSNPAASTSTLADVNCCASFNPTYEYMFQGFRVWRKHKYESNSLDSQDSQKVELDQYYLEQPPENLSEEYNVLEWWHANAPRFPILGRMARDFFAIPISTIVSESSAAEEAVKMSSTFNDARPEIIEALVCVRDWLESPERK